MHYQYVTNIPNVVNVNKQQNNRFINVVENRFIHYHVMWSSTVDTLKLSSLQKNFDETINSFIFYSFPMLTLLPAKQ